MLIEGKLVLLKGPEGLRFQKPAMDAKVLHMVECANKKFPKWLVSIW